MTGSMANRANDGGFLALLLVSCGLDALTRSGPFGRLLGAAVGCVALIIGLVFITIYLVNTDFSEQSGNGNQTNAKGIPHTPEDASTETWWTTFILLFGFFLLVSTPMFIYVPRYMWRPERQSQTAVVQGTPVPTTVAVPEGCQQRPLLAFRVDGEHGELV